MWSIPLLALLLCPVQDDGEYYLPWPAGKTYGCGQGNNGSFSHKGKSKYAWDFSMKTGTVITAVRSGKVIHVKEDSNQGGASKQYMNKSNLLLIEHDDGTIAAYGHLKQNGILVEKGDWVMRGQKVALSGQTGYAASPHLHFHVAKSDGQSIPIKFADVEGNGVPRSGRKYESKNEPEISEAEMKRLKGQEQGGALAIQLGAYGAAWELFKLVEKCKHPTIKARAAAKLKEIETAGTAAAAKTGEALLKARIAFKGAPAQRAIVDAIEAMEDRETLEKELKKPLKAYQALIDGVRSEVRGEFKSAARSYKKCVKAAKKSSHATVARKRLAEVEGKDEAPAAPGAAPAPKKKKSPFGRGK